MTRTAHMIFAAIARKQIQDRLWSCVGAVLVSMAVGCGTDDSRLSGKGVITETTNAPAARGRLATADSTPITAGSVRAVVDEDVPEAWNGISRSMSAVESDGSFRLSGLDKPAFVLYAEAVDSKGRQQTGRLPFTVKGQDDFVLPDLVVTTPASLQGRFVAFDSVVRTLPSSWKLRAKVRGLGRETFLDSTGSWTFDHIPAGTYRVRIEKVDGIPGHETTLWDSTLTAG